MIKNKDKVFISGVGFALINALSLGTLGVVDGWAGAVFLVVYSSFWQPCCFLAQKLYSQSLAIGQS
jgi:hypothetical protein